jgi:MFS family permease
MDVPASPSSASTLCVSPSLESTWKDAEKGEKDLEEIHLDGDSDDGSVLLKTPCRSHKLRDVGTLVGGFLGIAATGGMGNAVGLLQRHWEDHQLKDYSPRDVGWIAGTSICLSLFLPVLAGPIFDRYGHRWLLIAGTFSFCLGILLVSFFDEAVPERLCFSMLVLSWGVLCGMGNGLVNTATSGVVCRLFDKRRGLAAGIVSCGNSVGGKIWPMLLRDTLNRWGWKWAIKALAGLALILLLLSNLLVRDSPYRVVEEKPKKMKIKRGTALKMCVQEGTACFKSGTFVWMTISLALAQFVIMGVVGTLPSWGDEQGYDTDLLFNFVAAMNA